MLAYVTGLVNQDLLLQNEYLAAENRILPAHLPQRLRLSDPQRATLAGIGKRMGRKPPPRLPVFRSRAIPTSECPSGRTDWSRSILRPWRFSRRARASIPDCCRDAGELRDAYRRKRISAARRGFRADLWRNDLLRYRYVHRSRGIGPTLPIQLHARSADLVRPQPGPTDAIVRVLECDCP